MGSTYTFRSLNPSYQCGTRGNLPLAKFENNLFVTTDESIADALQSLDRFDIDFVEVTDTDAAPETHTDATAPSNTRPLWCVDGDDGAILSDYTTDGDEYAFEWTTEPGAVIAFKKKKDAAAFIESAQLDGSMAVKLPEGYTALV